MHKDHPMHNQQIKFHDIRLLPCCDSMFSAYLSMAIPGPGAQFSRFSWFGTGSTDAAASLHMPNIIQPLFSSTPDIVGNGYFMPVPMGTQRGGNGISI